MSDTFCIIWRMSHLAPIYAVWDHNAESMASDIDEQGVKVRQWRNRGNIPASYWDRIIQEAAKRGVVLQHAQFIRRFDDLDYSADTVVEARTVLCATCELRTDDPATASCTFIDCPHSQRQAA